MESLTIWHWIIIAILAVLVVAAISLFARAINNGRPAERGAKDRSGSKPFPGSPSGFGGWLLFAAFGVFASPIYTAILASKLEDGVDDATLQKYRLVFNGELGLFLALLFLQICTAFFMVRRSSGLNRFMS
jgi:hypothetical protein